METAASDSHHIQTPPTQGGLSTTFRLTALGQGSDYVESIELDANAGRVSLDDTWVNVIAYERIPWLAFNLVLFQLIGIEADAVHVLWLYCTPAGFLTHVWHEKTHFRPLSAEEASGICVGLPGQWTAHADFPALDAGPPPLAPGFTISGDEIQLAGPAAGSIRILGRDWIFFGFEDVDCSQICGGAGWWELHCLFWDPVNAEAAFGILYFFEGVPGQVDLHYGLTWPGLDRFAHSYDADWAISS